MLGELPFTSRRNLFGGWNQIFPELTNGFFLRLITRSSLKSAGVLRFWRIPARRFFRSPSETGAVFPRDVSATNASATSTNTRIPITLSRQLAYSKANALLSASQWHVVKSN